MPLDFRLKVPLPFKRDVDEGRKKKKNRKSMQSAVVEAKFFMRF